MYIYQFSINHPLKIGDPLQFGGSVQFAMRHACVTCVPRAAWMRAACSSICRIQLNRRHELNRRIELRRRIATVSVFKKHTYISIFTTTYLYIPYI